MTDSIIESIMSLGTDDVGSVPTKPTTPNKSYMRQQYKYVCNTCCGTGERNNQTCRSCWGKGGFQKSLAERMTAKRKRNLNRTNKIKEFQQEHPDQYKWLITNSEKFAFAGSLYTQLMSKGRLTPGQMDAIDRCVERYDAKVKENKAKEEKQLAKSPSVDVSHIKKHLNSAKDNGLRHPKLSIGDFTFSLAPDTGKNPGAVYVKNTGDYAGKIIHGKYAGRQEYLQELVSMCIDLPGAVREHGHKTGQCSCCNRKLTNPESVELGIGPICRDKFGF